MTLNRTLSALTLATLALLAAPAALASGDFGEPRDELVSRFNADFDVDTVLHGNIGIALPTWGEASLYLAWRATVTGGKAPHWAAAASTPQGDVPKGWTDAAADAVSKPELGGGLTNIAERYGERPNCAPDAQSFAVLTLGRLQARPDRSQARVDAWLAAQNQVFALCGRDPLDVLEGKDALLDPLPASEPLYWRQLREYQMASATFYAARYAQSRQAFTRIGTTPGHPMQGWGAYLALRSHLRAVQLPKEAALKTNAAGPTPAPPEQLADLEALRREGAAILHDATLAPVHEAAAATLRRAAYLLAPAHRFAELTAMLDDLQADPDQDDTLADWMAMGYTTGDKAADARTQAALRAAHPWYDWVEGVTQAQGVVTAAVAANGFRNECEGDCLYASQAWSRGLATAAHRPDATEASQHRAWLVAALMSDAPLTPAMEKEALGVLVRAPEYATVRYHLARRLSAAKRGDEARAMSEGLLARLGAQKPMSTSAVNLVTQQRFADATSVVDAGAYLLMTPGASTNPDTGERAAPDGTYLATSDAGLRWLDRSLSVADLLTLARSLKTPSPTRTGIAVAAWMRADLLGDAKAALDASTLVEQYAPALKPVTTRYRALPDAAERQHWLIANALRLNLSPVPVAQNRDASGKYPVNKPDETVASMWCHLGADVIGDDATPEQRNGKAPPEVTGDVAQRDAELARLLKLHSATGFVGLHAIDWASSHPADKDLPWLLYVAVQSSRGGCTDPDHTAISKKAWQILHKRFPKSPWTEQTPYFY
jgi:hypothetical protein